MGETFEETLGKNDLGLFAHQGVYKNLHQVSEPSKGSKVSADSDEFDHEPKQFSKAS